MATELDKIAYRYEKKIQNALIDAFDILRNQYTIPQLTEVINSRGVYGVMELFSDIDTTISSAIVPQINNAINESGTISIELIPKGAIEGSISFNMLNENTTSFIRSYQVPLVRQISNNTKEAIRNSINIDLAAGRGPRSTAIQFRKDIGLTTKQEQYVRNFENALKWQSETDPVKRRQLRNNLQQAIKGDKYKLQDKRFRSSMNKLLNEEKISNKQIDKMVTRYRERYIKYRSEVIARTEALRATSVGNHEMLKQNIESGSVNDNILRFWDATNDRRTRPWHNKAEVINSKGVKWNQAFKVPNSKGSIEQLMYPRDPAGSPDNTVQCRCAVYYKYKDRRK